VHRGTAIAAVRAAAAIAHGVAASRRRGARNHGREEDGKPHDHILLDAQTPKEVRDFPATQSGGATDLAVTLTRSGGERWVPANWKALAVV